MPNPATADGLELCRTLGLGGVDPGPTAGATVARIAILPSFSPGAALTLSLEPASPARYSFLGIRDGPEAQALVLPQPPQLWRHSGTDEAGLAAAVLRTLLDDDRTGGLVLDGVAYEAVAWTPGGKQSTAGNLATTVGLGEAILALVQATRSPAGEGSSRRGLGLLARSLGAEVEVDELPAPQARLRLGIIGAEGDRAEVLDAIRTARERDSK